MNNEITDKITDNDSVNKTRDNLNKMSFEEIIAKIEDITAKLESGSMPLNQAVETYTYGIELKKVAEKQLKSAYLKLQYVQENKAITQFREQLCQLLEQFQNATIKSLEAKEQIATIKTINEEFFSDLSKIYVDTLQNIQ